MIDKPSLLDTPNLINMKEYTPSPIPGESVDECYAWDSLIRGDYNTGYTPDWDEGKVIQETLPAAQWDAFIHDLTAYGWETTQLLISLWEEMYCLIHGSTTGYDQEAITNILSGSQTFTNKIISFDDNTLQNVASLNTAQTLTNKTISFDDNTLQNVASLDTAQTLKNKTINSQDNILIIEKKQASVTCLPTVYSSTPLAPISPTKEMNIQIDTPGVALTLGTGPYIGYTVPITATAACTVTYTGANGNVTDNFDVGQTINYIWKGSYWGSVSNASLPVFINSSQTVSPTMDMNYVISTAAVNLSLDPGARIGHKIAVTATADGAVTYLGVNGPTTQAIGTGYRCELTWNGSYWLMAMFSVIEGIDAAGSPFQFGGEVSVAPVPSAGYIEILTDGETLDTSEGELFLVKVEQDGATCTLSSPTYTGQSVTVVNRASIYPILITYNGGYTYLLSAGRLVTMTGRGTTWNFEGYAAIVVHSNMTLNPVNNCAITIDTENATVTMGNGTFVGQRHTLYAAVNNVFVFFKSSVNDSMTRKMYAGYAADLIWNGTYWVFILLTRSTVHSVQPINAGTLSSGGYIRFCVTGGTCTLTVAGLQTSGTTAGWYAVAGPIPYAALGAQVQTPSGNQMSTIDIGGHTYLQIYRSNGNLLYGTISYAVDNNWYEY